MDRPAQIYGLFGQESPHHVRWHVVGDHSPHESPEAPELRLDTTGGSMEVMADRPIAFLRERDMIA